MTSGKILQSPTARGRASRALFSIPSSGLNERAKRGRRPKSSESNHYQRNNVSVFSNEKPKNDPIRSRDDYSFRHNPRSNANENIFEKGNKRSLNDEERGWRASEKSILPVWQVQGSPGPSIASSSSSLLPEFHQEKLSNSEGKISQRKQPEPLIVFSASTRHPTRYDPNVANRNLMSSNFANNISKRYVYKKDLENNGLERNGLRRRSKIENTERNAQRRKVSASKTPGEPYIRETYTPGQTLNLHGKFKRGFQLVPVGQNLYALREDFQNVGVRSLPDDSSSNFVDTLRETEPFLVNNDNYETRRGDRTSDMLSFKAHMHHNVKNIGNNFRRKVADQGNFAPFVNSKDLSVSSQDSRNLPDTSDTSGSLQNEPSPYASPEFLQKNLANYNQARNIPQFLDYPSNSLINDRSVLDNIELYGGSNLLYNANPGMAGTQYVLPSSSLQDRNFDSEYSIDKFSENRLPYDKQRVSGLSNSLYSEVGRDDSIYQAPLSVDQSQWMGNVDFTVPRDSFGKIDNLERDVRQNSDETSTYHLKYLNEYARALDVMSGRYSNDLDDISSRVDDQSDGDEDVGDQAAVLESTKTVDSSVQSQASLDDIDGNISGQSGNVVNPRDVSSSRDDQIEPPVASSKTLSVLNANAYEYPNPSYIPQRILNSRPSYDTITDTSTVSSSSQEEKTTADALQQRNKMKGKSFANVVEPLTAQLQKLLSTIKLVNDNLTKDGGGGQGSDGKAENKRGVASSDKTRKKRHEVYPNDLFDGDFAKNSLDIKNRLQRDEKTSNDQSAEHRNGCDNANIFGTHFQGSRADEGKNYGDAKCKRNPGVMDFIERALGFESKNHESTTETTVATFETSSAEPTDPETTESVVQTTNTRSTTTEEYSSASETMTENSGSFTDNISTDSNTQIHENTTMFVPTSEEVTVPSIRTTISRMTEYGESEETEQIDEMPTDQYGIKEKMGTTVLPSSKIVQSTTRGRNFPSFSNKNNNASPVSAFRVNVYKNSTDQYDRTAAKNMPTTQNHRTISQEHPRYQEPVGSLGSLIRNNIGHPPDEQKNYSLELRNTSVNQLFTPSAVHTLDNDRESDNHAKISEKMTPSTVLKASSTEASSQAPKQPVNHSERQKAQEYGVQELLVKLLASEIIKNITNAKPSQVRSTSTQGLPELTKVGMLKQKINRIAPTKPRSYASSSDSQTGRKSEPRVTAGASKASVPNAQKERNVLESSKLRQHPASMESQITQTRNYGDGITRHYSPISNKKSETIARTLVADSIGDNARVDIRLKIPIHHLQNRRKIALRGSKKRKCKSSENMKNPAKDDGNRDLPKRSSYEDYDDGDDNNEYLSDYDVYSAKDYDLERPNLSDAEEIYDNAYLKALEHAEVYEDDYDPEENVNDETHESLENDDDDTEQKGGTKKNLYTSKLHIWPEPIDQESLSKLDALDASGRDASTPLYQPPKGPPRGKNDKKNHLKDKKVSAIKKKPKVSNYDSPGYVRLGRKLHSVKCHRKLLSIRDELDLSILDDDVVEKLLLTPIEEIATSSFEPSVTTFPNEQEKTATPTGNKRKNTTVGNVEDALATLEETTRTIMKRKVAVKSPAFGIKRNESVFERKIHEITSVMNKPTTSYLISGTIAQGIPLISKIPESPEAEPEKTHSFHENITTVGTPKISQKLATITICKCNASIDTLKNVTVPTTSKILLTTEKPRRAKSDYDTFMSKELERTTEEIEYSTQLTSTEAETILTIEHSLTKFTPSTGTSKVSEITETIGREEKRDVSVSIFEMSPTMTSIDSESNPSSPSITDTGIMSLADTVTASKTTETISMIDAMIPSVIESTPSDVSVTSTESTTVESTMAEFTTTESTTMESAITESTEPLMTQSTMEESTISMSTMMVATTTEPITTESTTTEPPTTVFAITESTEFSTTKLTMPESTTTPSTITESIESLTTERITTESTMTEPPTTEFTITETTESSTTKPTTTQSTITESIESSTMERITTEFTMTETSTTGPTTTESSITESTESLTTKLATTDSTISISSLPDVTITEPMTTQITITEPTTIATATTEAAITESTITESTESGMTKSTKNMSTMTEVTITEPITTQITITESVQSATMQPTTAESTMTEPTTEGSVITESTESVTTEPAMTDSTISIYTMTEAKISTPMTTQFAITESRESATMQPTTTESTMPESASTESTKSTTKESTISISTMTEATITQPTTTQITIAESAGSATMQPTTMQSTNAKSIEPSTTESTVPESTITESTESLMTESTIKESIINMSTTTQTTITQPITTQITITDSVESSPTETTTTESEMPESATTESTNTESTESLMTKSTMKESTISMSTMTEATITQPMITQITIAESVETATMQPTSTQLTITKLIESSTMEPTTTESPETESRTTEPTTTASAITESLESSTTKLTMADSTISLSTMTETKITEPVSTKITITESIELATMQPATSVSTVSEPLQSAITESTESTVKEIAITESTMGQSTITHSMVSLMTEPTTTEFTVTQSTIAAMMTSSTITELIDSSTTESAIIESTESSMTKPSIEKSTTSMSAMTEAKTTEPVTAEITITESVESVTMQPTTAEVTVSESVQSTTTELTESAVSESSTTEPTTTESSTTELTMTESSMTKPTMTESTISMSAMTEAEITSATIQPVTIESTVSEPVLSAVTESTESTVTEFTTTESTITYSVVPLMTESTTMEATITGSAITESTITDSVTTRAEIVVEITEETTRESEDTEKRPYRSSNETERTTIITALVRADEDYQETSPTTETSEVSLPTGKTTTSLTELTQSETSESEETITFSGSLTTSEYIESSAENISCTTEKFVTVMSELESESTPLTIMSSPIEETDTSTRRVGFPSQSISLEQKTTATIDEEDVSTVGSSASSEQTVTPASKTEFVDTSESGRKTESSGQLSSERPTISDEVSQEDYAAPDEVAPETSSQLESTTSSVETPIEASIGTEIPQSSSALTESSIVSETEGTDESQISTETTELYEKTKISTEINTNTISTLSTMGFRSSLSFETTEGTSPLFSVTNTTLTEGGTEEVGTRGPGRTTEERTMFTKDYYIDTTTLPVSLENTTRGGQKPANTTTETDESMTLPVSLGPSDQTTLTSSMGTATSTILQEISSSEISMADEGKTSTFETSPTVEMEITTEITGTSIGSSEVDVTQRDTDETSTLIGKTDRLTSGSGPPENFTANTESTVESTTGSELTAEFTSTIEPTGEFAITSEFTQRSTSESSILTDNYTITENVTSASTQETSLIKIEQIASTESTEILSRKSFVTEETTTIYSTELSNITNSNDESMTLAVSLGPSDETTLTSSMGTATSTILQEIGSSELFITEEGKTSTFETSPTVEMEITTEVTDTSIGTSEVDVTQKDTDESSTLIGKTDRLTSGSGPPENFTADTESTVESTTGSELTAEFTSTIEPTGEFAITSEFTQRSTSESSILTDNYTITENATSSSTQETSLIKIEQIASTESIENLSRKSFVTEETTTIYSTELSNITSVLMETELDVTSSASSMSSGFETSSSIEGYSDNAETYETITEIDEDLQTEEYNESSNETGEPEAGQWSDYEESTEASTGAHRTEFTEKSPEDMATFDITTKESDEITVGDSTTKEIGDQDSQSRSEATHMSDMKSLKDEEQKLVEIEKQQLKRRQELEAYMEELEKREDSIKKREKRLKQKLEDLKRKKAQKESESTEGTTEKTTRTELFTSTEEMVSSEFSILEESMSSVSELSITSDEISTTVSDTSTAIEATRSTELSTSSEESLTSVSDSAGTSEELLTAITETTAIDEMISTELSTSREESLSSVSEPLDTSEELLTSVTKASTAIEEAISTELSTSSERLLSNTSESSASSDDTLMTTSIELSTSLGGLLSSLSESSGTSEGILTTVSEGSTVIDETISTELSTSVSESSITPEEILTTTMETSVTVENITMTTGEQETTSDIVNVEELDERRRNHSDVEKELDELEQNIKDKEKNLDEREKALDREEKQLDEDLKNLEDGKATGSDTDLSIRPVIESTTGTPVPPVEETSVTKAGDIGKQTKSTKRCKTKRKKGRPSKDKGDEESEDEESDKYVFDPEEEVWKEKQPEDCDVPSGEMAYEDGCRLKTKARKNKDYKSATQDVEGEDKDREDADEETGDEIHDARGGDTDQETTNINDKDEDRGHDDGETTDVENKDQDREDADEETVDEIHDEARGEHTDQETTSKNDKDEDRGHDDEETTDVENKDQDRERDDKETSDIKNEDQVLEDDTTEMNAVHEQATKKVCLHVLQNDNLAAGSQKHSKDYVTEVVCLPYNPEEIHDSARRRRRRRGRVARKLMDHDDNYDTSGSVDFSVNPTVFLDKRYGNKLEKNMKMSCLNLLHHEWQNTGTTPSFHEHKGFTRTYENSFKKPKDAGTSLDENAEETLRKRRHENPNAEGIKDDISESSNIHSLRYEQNVNDKKRITDYDRIDDNMADDNEEAEDNDFVDGEVAMEIDEFGNLDGSDDGNTKKPKNLIYKRNVEDDIFYGDTEIPDDDYIKQSDKILWRENRKEQEVTNDLVEDEAEKAEKLRKRVAAEEQELSHIEERLLTKEANLKKEEDKIEKAEKAFLASKRSLKPNVTKNPPRPTKVRRRKIFELQEESPESGSTEALGSHEIVERDEWSVDDLDEEDDNLFDKNKRAFTVNVLRLQYDEDEENHKIKHEKPSMEELIGAEQVDEETEENDESTDEKAIAPKSKAARKKSKSRKPPGSQWPTEKTTKYHLGGTLTWVKELSEDPSKFRKTRKAEIIEDDDYYDDLEGSYEFLDDYHEREKRHEGQTTCYTVVVKSGKSQLSGKSNDYAKRLKKSEDQIEQPRLMKIQQSHRWRSIDDKANDKPKLKKSLRMLKRDVLGRQLSSFEQFHEQVDPINSQARKNNPPFNHLFINRNVSFINKNPKLRTIKSIGDTEVRENSECNEEEYDNEGIEKREDDEEYDDDGDDDRQAMRRESRRGDESTSLDSTSTIRADDYDFFSPPTEEIITKLEEKATSVLNTSLPKNTATARATEPSRLDENKMLSNVSIFVATTDATSTGRLTKANESKFSGYVVDAYTTNVKDFQNDTVTKNQTHERYDERNRLFATRPIRIDTASKNKEMAENGTRSRIGEEMTVKISAGSQGDRSTTETFSKSSDTSNQHFFGEYADYGQDTKFEKAISSIRNSEEHKNSIHEETTDYDEMLFGEKAINKSFSQEPGEKLAWLEQDLVSKKKLPILIRLDDDKLIELKNLRNPPKEIYVLYKCGPPIIAGEYSSTAGSTEKKTTTPGMLEIITRTVLPKKVETTTINVLPKKTETTTIGETMSEVEFTTNDDNNINYSVPTSTDVVTDGKINPEVENINLEPGENDFVPLCGGFVDTEFARSLTNGAAEKPTKETSELFGIIGESTMKVISVTTELKEHIPSTERAKEVKTRKNAKTDSSTRVSIETAKYGDGLKTVESGNKILDSSNSPVRQIALKKMMSKKKKSSSVKKLSKSSGKEDDKEKRLKKSEIRSSRSIDSNSNDTSVESWEAEVNLESTEENHFNLKDREINGDEDLSYDIMETDNRNYDYMPHYEDFDGADKTGRSLLGYDKSSMSFEESSSIRNKKESSIKIQEKTKNINSKSKFSKPIHSKLRNLRDVKEKTLGDGKQGDFRKSLALDAGVLEANDNSAETSGLLNKVMDMMNPKSDSDKISVEDASSEEATREKIKQEKPRNLLERVKDIIGNAIGVKKKNKTETSTEIVNNSATTTSSTISPEYIEMKNLLRETEKIVSSLKQLEQEERAAHSVNSKDDSLRDHAQRFYGPEGEAESTRTKLKKVPPERKSKTSKVEPNKTEKDVKEKLAKKKNSKERKPDIGKKKSGKNPQKKWSRSKQKKGVSKAKFASNNAIAQSQKDSVELRQDDSATENPSDKKVNPKLVFKENSKKLGTNDIIPRVRELLEKQKLGNVEKIIVYVDKNENNHKSHSAKESSLKRRRVIAGKKAKSRSISFPTKSKEFMKKRSFSVDPTDTDSVVRDSVSLQDKSDFEKSNVTDYDDENLSDPLKKGELSFHGVALDEIVSQVADEILKSSAYSRNFSETLDPRISVKVIQEVAKGTELPHEETRTEFLLDVYGKPIPSKGKLKQSGNLPRLTSKTSERRMNLADVPGKNSRRNWKKKIRRDEEGIRKRNLGIIRRRLLRELMRRLRRRRLRRSLRNLQSRRSLLRKANEKKHTRIFPRYHKDRAIDEKIRLIYALRHKNTKERKKNHSPNILPSQRSAHRNVFAKKQSAKVRPKREDNFEYDKEHYARMDENNVNGYKENLMNFENQNEVVVKNVSDNSSMNKSLIHNRDDPKSSQKSKNNVKKMALDAESSKQIMTEDKISSNDAVFYNHILDLEKQLLRQSNLSLKNSSENMCPENLKDICRTTFEKIKNIVHAGAHYLLRHFDDCRHCQYDGNHSENSPVKTKREDRSTKDVENMAEKILHFASKIDAQRDGEKKNRKMHDEEVDKLVEKFGIDELGLTSEADKKSLAALVNEIVNVQKNVNQTLEIIRTRLGSGGKKATSPKKFKTTSRSKEKSGTRKYSEKAKKGDKKQRKDSKVKISEKGQKKKPKDKGIHEAKGTSKKVKKSILRRRTIGKKNVSSMEKKKLEVKLNPDKHLDDIGEEIRQILTEENDRESNISAFQGQTNVNSSRAARDATKISESRDFFPRLARDIDDTNIANFGKYRIRRVRSPAWNRDDLPSEDRDELIFKYFPKLLDLTNANFKYTKRNASNTNRKRSFGNSTLVNSKFSSKQHYPVHPRPSKARTTKQVSSPKSPKKSGTKKSDKSRLGPKKKPKKKSKHVHEPHRHPMNEDSNSVSKATSGAIKTEKHLDAKKASTASMEDRENQMIKLKLTGRINIGEESRENGDTPKIQIPHFSARRKLQSSFHMVARENSANEKSISRKNDKSMGRKRMMKRLAKKNPNAGKKNRHTSKSGDGGNSQTVIPIKGGRLRVKYIYRNVTKLAEDRTRRLAKPNTRSRAREVKKDGMINFQKQQKAKSTSVPATGQLIKKTNCTSCICDLMETIEGLKKMLTMRGDTLAKVIGYECPKYEDIGDEIVLVSTGIIGDVLPRSRRDLAEAKGMESVKSEDLEDLLKDEVDSDEKNELVSFPGNDLNIPCYHGGEDVTWLTSISKPNYTWTRDGGLPVSGLMRKNGNLELYEVDVKDSGNYTCRVSYIDPDNEELVQNSYVHRIQVVTLPRYTLRGGNRYFMENCDEIALDVLASHLPKKINDILCKGSVCDAFIYAPRCHHSQISIRTLILPSSTAKLFPIGGNQCGFQCRKALQDKVTLITSRNLRNVLHKPIVFRLPHRPEDRLIPIIDEPKISRNKRTKRRNGSNGDADGEVGLLVGCPAGYGLHDGHCVPCSPGTHSDNLGSRCKRCSTGTHQPNAGARTCRACTNPFVEGCYRMFWSSSSAVMAILVSLCAVMTIFMILVWMLCCSKGRKTQNDLPCARSTKVRLKYQPGIGDRSLRQPLIDRCRDSTEEDERCCECEKIRKKKKRFLRRKLLAKDDCHEAPPHQPMERRQRIVKDRTDQKVQRVRTVPISRIDSYRSHGGGHYRTNSPKRNDYSKPPLPLPDFPR